MNRAEAIKHLEEWVEVISIPSRKEAVNMAIKALRQERPKGEWQIKECDSIYGKKYILTCAECGGSVSVTKEALPYENFCRECGADMRGGKE